jgi:GNAT superfamily N-acetyltransferase
MDFDKVTQMLSMAYWSVGIGKDEVMKGAANSTLVFGVFDEANHQIAYARVLSDKVRFCYLMDVIVDEKFRRQGIGQDLVKYILNYSELADVYTWTLRTADAHGVYEKFGFKQIENPQEWMIIAKSRPLR